jgi:hypothetical protein
LNGIYNDYMKDKLKQLNDQNNDIYFVVNGGGTHKADINKINAVFVDFDCGRDEKEEYKPATITPSGGKKYSYFPLDIVEKFKEQCLINIQQFDFIPSLIVETRNGYHIYWLISENASTTEFVECQNRLIQHFKSDERINTLDRIMRLPNYWWSKEGYDRFLSKVVLYNDLRYNIKDIINGLPEIIPEMVKAKKKEKIIFSNKVSKPTINLSNVELIKALNVEGMRNNLFGTNYGAEGYQGGTIDKINTFFYCPPTLSPIKVTNRNELYDYISKFNCFFHADTTESANIFINPDTGHYIYKCFSSNCHMPAAGIITVVERLAKCSKPKAINFIKQVLNINLVESEWQIEQKEILQANKDYLYSRNMEEEFPTLYKRIKNYIPLLILINDIAMNNVYDESFTDDDKVVFFASIRYIQSLMSSSKTDKLNDRINLFAFLELLKKLDESDIPQKMLIKAKHEAAKKKQTKLTTFYSIPSYSYDVLNLAENNATIFNEKNMTMKGWSRELLLRNFGNEITDKVYPQLKGKALSEISENFKIKFSCILLKIIDEKGYSTEKECVALIKGYSEINQIKIKRVLQEVLDSYGLKRIKSNKELKLKYNITGTGYPSIIINR